MRRKAMSVKKTPIAVLVSGSGSNLQALIDACAQPDYPANIKLVLSNKADAYGLERAKKANIATAVISHKDYANRTDFEQAIHNALLTHKVEFVCLAGFMRILEDTFVTQWQDRMINIHPSLLPKYKGLHTHKRAIEAGDTHGGCTVHYVVPEMDAGPIIAQESVEISNDETPDSLAAKVLKKEHLLYPRALKLALATNK